ncbi:MAG: ribosome biogenesis GTPase Der [Acidobacteria bacterium]|nr:ribosome biogenesis GTPase Der [Acidobacteriota bacterium]
MPSVVIVGRPNVGKSTLCNRLTGSRRSIVTNEPGITRDRIHGTATWEGRTFEVVDTGGLLPDDKAEIPREILRQAQVAIAAADQLVLVVDARAGMTPLDADLARLLRRTGKRLAIAANKVDTPAQSALAAPFYELANDVYPLSAEHGFGIEELLDAVTREFPSAEAAGEEAAAAEGVVQVAIIGRPNVGKSTLLNRLVGAERAIVAREPGTTRDSVDTFLHRGEKAYRFIDTAGIRRKGKTKLVAEKLSVIMARKSLERADVTLLVADAEQGVTAGDATIAGYAEQSGRSVIIVMNKWDLALEAARKEAEREAMRSAPLRRRGTRAGKSAPGKETSAKVDPGRLLADYERIVRARFKFLDYAPVIFLSAFTGERVNNLYALIDRVAAARRQRIPTGELNRWLAAVDLERGTSPAARRIKIFYITQASTSPPTFILFTNQTQRLHFSYERFLENQLRARFDFTGTPIRFLQRLKEKRSPGRR